MSTLEQILQSAWKDQNSPRSLSGPFLRSVIQVSWTQPKIYSVTKPKKYKTYIAFLIRRSLFFRFWLWSLWLSCWFSFFKFFEFIFVFFASFPFPITLSSTSSGPSRPSYFTFSFQNVHLAVSYCSVKVHFKLFQTTETTNNASVDKN